LLDITVLIVLLVVVGGGYVMVRREEEEAMVTPIRGTAQGQSDVSRPAPALAPEGRAFAGRTEHLSHEVSDATPT
jgi:hypothetical protein